MMGNSTKKSSPSYQSKENDQKNVFLSYEEKKKNVIVTSQTTTTKKIKGMKDKNST